MGIAPVEGLGKECGRFTRGWVSCIASGLPRIVRGLRPGKRWPGSVEGQVQLQAVGQQLDAAVQSPVAVAEGPEAQWWLGLDVMTVKVSTQGCELGKPPGHIASARRRRALTALTSHWCEPRCLHLC